MVQADYHMTRSAAVLRQPSDGGQHGKNGHAHHHGENGHGHSAGALRLSAEEFRRWNEEMAVRYSPDAYHERSSALIRFVERRRTSAVLAALQPRPSDHILEVGCGAGNLLRAIPCGRLYGIDLSEGLLAIAARRIAGRPGGVTLANAECLPFRDGTFDKVLITEVLEHVQSPERVVEEMLRVGKPEARFVFSWPNEAVIEGGKRWFKRLRLSALLNTRAYQVSDHMDWHIHEMDMAFFCRLVKDRLRVHSIVAVPWKPLPFRYVAACSR